jgi:hypothetical protein
MKTRLAHHVIAIVLAVPVFAIAVGTALDYPPNLNPWHKSSGPFDFNIWFLVLPQLLCSIGIIINGVLAIRSSRKHEA